MSFINEEEEVPKLESESVTKPEKQKKDSSFLSIIFLVLILVALYYGKDYLSGEKEIPGFSDALSQVEKESSDAEPVGSLKIPKESDRVLKNLLAEFKEEYEEMYGSEKMMMTQPEVKMIRFSEDKRSLLIELETLLPSSGIKQSEDILYEMDDFGRLVAEGSFATIKLHPPKK